MFKKSILLSTVLLLGTLNAEGPIFPPIEQAIPTQIEETKKALAIHTSNNSKALDLFDTLSREWNTYYQNNPSAVQTLLHATAFAAIHQDEQTDGITKALQRANTLWTEGNIRSVNTLAAALIQDSKASKETIALQFGPQVEQTIDELASHNTLPKELQIEDSLSLTPDAQLILMADAMQSPNQDKAQNEHLVQVLHDLNKQLADAVLKHLNLS